jgi:segregation and condensation protein B
VLVKIAGGWRYQTAPDLAAYVERFALEGQSARMSAAALETLAIVAYKQPLSRAQISAIRGVNVDGVMRTLQQRGYIEEVARDPGPGQAVLFGTTTLFLEKLGISSLDDLPPLGEFVPSAEVVEALEQGLRVTADVEVDASDDASPLTGGASEPAPEGS